MYILVDRYLPGQGLCELTWIRYGYIFSTNSSQIRLEDSASRVQAESLETFLVPFAPHLISPLVLEYLHTCNSSRITLVSRLTIPPVISHTLIRFPKISFTPHNVAGIYMYMEGCGRFSWQSAWHMMVGRGILEKVGAKVLCLST